MTWHFQNLSHGFQNLKQRDISERSSWRKELGGLWYVVHESAQRAGSPKFPIWPGFLGARYLVNKKYSTTHQSFWCSSLGGIGSFLNRQKTTKKNLMEFRIRSRWPSVSVWPCDLGFYWGSLKKARAQTKGCSHLSKRNELMFAWCFYLEDAFKFCFFFVFPPNLWDTDTVMIKLPQKILTSFASPPKKYSILSFKFVDGKIFHLTPPRWRLQTSIWSRGDFTAFNHHLSPLQLGAASMKPMVGRNGRPFNWKIRWEYGRFSLKFGDIFLFLFEHFKF